MGIDPANEPKVTYLNKRIRQGEYLSAGKDDEIILGKDLAQNLNVAIGDKIVVMASGSDGSLASAAYRLAGTLDTGAEEIDKALALITLRAAQDLLVLGEKVSEIALRIDSVYQAPRFAGALKEKIDTDNFEVLTWKEISPMTAQWLEFDRAFINAILFIVLLVVASGIFNTIMMSVLDRIREFGIMLALGTKRRQVVLMISLEGAILGLIGILAGSFLGCASSFYFSRAGINLAKFATAFESYYTGSIIYPRLQAGYVFLFSLAVFVISILVAIYPTFKAVNLRPIEALKHF
jgi:ABC-type lipoprotein release transport system permease subunit